MALIITLLVLGAILMFLETFLPGMVTGIIGLLCLASAVIIGYKELGYYGGNLILGVALLGLVIGGWCWLRFFPESRIARLFVSRSTVGELGVARLDLLHRTGVAITQLRPSGDAFINGQRVDVISEGALIDRGASLKVVAVEGMRVVVREVV
jgi:membrane-bound serine protease (ClpP class)